MRATKSTRPRTWYLRAAVALCLVASVTHGEQVAEAPLYKDPSQPVDARVADLLSRMTLEEKVAQLLCLWKDKNLLLDEAGRFVPEKAAKAIPHGAGHVARPSDNWQRGTAGVDSNRTPRETVELVNGIQRYLLEDTRLSAFPAAQSRGEPVASPVWSTGLSVASRRWWAEASTRRWPG